MNLKEEYISAIRDIIDTFFDGSQVKFSQFVGVSTSTLSRVLNGSNISELFQTSLYDKLSNLEGLPIEALEAIEPFNFEQTSEVVIDKRKELLFKIARQIKHNEISKITPKDKDTVLNIYENLYNIIENLQYSIGGIKDYYSFSRIITIQLYYIRYCLLKYCYSNRFFSFTEQSLLNELIFYDICGIPSYDYEEEPNCTKLFVPHNYLNPFLKQGDFIVIKKAEKDYVPEIDKIGLFKYKNNILFLAKIIKSDSTSRVYYNIDYELLINNSIGSYRKLTVSEIKENEINLLGVVNL